MFKIVSLAILMWLSAMPAFTQEYKNQIKAGPFMLVNFINPGIELGFERHFSPKFSAQLTGVLLTDFMNITPYENFRGYRVKPEIRYYFYDGKKISVFTALEVDISRSNFEFSKEYVHLNDHPPGDSFPSYFERFDVEKRMLLFNSKAGIQLKLNRFAIEGTVNIGVKHRNIIHQEKETAIPEDYAERHIHYLDIQQKAALEGQRTRPNLGYAIKAGWRF